MVIITIASSIPNLRVANTIPETDKYVHIMIFAILAYLLTGSINKYIKSWKLVAQILLVVLLTTMFGFLDEWHQSIVVGRTSSQWDLLADTLGGFVGLIVFQIVHKEKI